MSAQSEIVLLDNGSLRPESVLSLRRISRELGQVIGKEVHPVSLLHSSKIDVSSLEGRSAVVWRGYLRDCLERGVTEVTVLPLFLGPSAAIVEYLPEVSEEIAAGRELRLTIGAPLIDGTDAADIGVAELLADFVRQRLESENVAGDPPAVLLVDHGSPLARVTACRDLVARQLKELLGDSVGRVVGASMERREGAEYDFNEPLLERAFDGLESADDSACVLAYLFISPGKHAGPSGDIDEIVRDSEWSRTGKPVFRCPLLGEHPGLVDLLAKRFRQIRS